MTREIENKAQLDKFMSKAYSKFFYLITEKLDESLLLLKDAWGWTLQDILYPKYNVSINYTITRYCTFFI
jgi:hypothetical protein